MEDALQVRIGSNIAGDRLTLALKITFPAPRTIAIRAIVGAVGRATSSCSHLSFLSCVFVNCTGRAVPFSGDFFACHDLAVPLNCGSLLRVE